LTGCDQATSPPPTASSPRQVYALGHLEPSEGVISISAIPGERLKTLDPDVIENRLAPANGILGLLTSYDLGKTQLEALQKKAQLSELRQQHEYQIAKAQQAQAVASLAQAQAKQKEVELQSGKLRALEVASQLAADEYTQLLELAQSDPELVTAHQLAKQANQLELARQDFLIASQSYHLTREAANKAVHAATANVEVARTTLEQLSAGYDQQAIAQEIRVAEETLKRSILLAPNVSSSSLTDVTNLECKQDCYPEQPETYGPYTVLKTFVRPGEFITQMPIVQLGDLSQMVCVAEVYEADVKELAVGQAVTIRSPALAGEFADGAIDASTPQATGQKQAGGMAGRVQRIGSLIASPGLSSRNPLAPADRSVIEVRIQITDPAATRQAAQRVGLQVTVEFGEKPGAASEQEEENGER
jgi:HlyD family secretion protein